jgi:iron complex outermembrane receptor protein
MGASSVRRFAGQVAATTAIAGVIATSAQAQQTILLPGIDVTSSRLGSGIVGTSTSIITAEEIARSPSLTLQDILSREPGIQTNSVFGGVNGAGTIVDMRGFGASAVSNSLILINGRRINDLDMAAIDFAAIPRDSIERIEITRGNSGAVLYGDGAVGGVINIVTKTGIALSPKARFEGAFGSFKQREGNASFSGSSGPWSASVYGLAMNSDGYRENNEYKQRSGVGDFRYTVQEGSAYLNLSGDDQDIGLPGARRVDSRVQMNQLITNRRGATTPYDFAGKQGASVTGGITRMLAPGVELIVDGGTREKKQQSQFYFATPTVATLAPLASADAVLQTSSLTPRVKLNGVTGGMPWNAISGIDYYLSSYEQDRSQFLGALPINRYNLMQSSVGYYYQHSVSVRPTTDISGGFRGQRTSLRASGTFNPDAPGGSFCDPFFGCFPLGAAPIPLDSTQDNQAYHLGAEHRFTPNFAVFGRMAQSFRVPNVDERVGMVTSQGGDPTNFSLRTQKSHDYEGGIRITVGSFNMQTSYYDMRLTDEIHFRFLPNFESKNINLDPTHRWGSETMASWAVNERLRFKGGFAYTRAQFREGPLAGNDVPLVSTYTGSGAVSWDILPQWLTFDGVVRYVGSRRMDNDQVNVQPLIPAFYLVDVRLGGQIDRFFWSFSVQNLFDKNYFDYSVASPFPFGPGSAIGVYNAYPLPGRTYMLKAGVNLP